MLKNIFDPKSPKRLMNKISLLSQENSEHQKSISKIMIENPEALTGIDLPEKIHSIAILLNIMESADAQLLPKKSSMLEIEKRLAKLFSADLSINNQHYFDKLIEDKSYTQLYLLALTIENPAYSKIIVEALTDHHSLVHDLIILGHNDLSASQAIETINDIDILKKIEKELRNKNKKTLRLVQTRIETIESYLQNAQQLRDKQEHLLNSIQHLATGSYFPLYASKYQHLSEEWQSLKQQWLVFENENHDLTTKFISQSISKSISQPTLQVHQELFEAASKACMLKISEAKTEENARQFIHENEELLNQNIDKFLDEVIAKEMNLTELKTSFNVITSQYKIFLSHHASGKTEEKRLLNEKVILLEHLLNYQLQLNSHTQNMSSAIEKSKELDDLFASDHKKKKASTDTFASILAGLKTFEKVASSFPLKGFEQISKQPFPESFMDVQDKHKHFKNLLAACETQQHEFLDRVNKKSGFLKAELNKKSLGQAHRLYNEIAELIVYCPSNQKEALNKRLNKQLEELAKVEDWYNFATLPKRKELCEAMEALCSNKQQPKIKLLQENIKSLQAEWKSLGHAKDAEGEVLWQRFQEAGNKAYEPIQTFLTGKETQKLDNLKKRESVCSALERYLENELSKSKNDIDWPAAEQFIKTQNRTWIQALPIPHSNKDLDARYVQLCTDFENKLDIQRKINLGLKKDLVQQSEKLLQNEDIQLAITQAKQLQETWKKTGYCKEGNELWDAFRKNCDQIFENRNKIHQQQKQSEQDAIQQAKSICAQINTLANSESAANSNEFEYRLTQLCTQFTNIKELPKTRKDLYTQFAEAKKQASKKLDELFARSKIQYFQKLDEFYKSIAGIEKIIIEQPFNDDLMNEIENLFQSSELEISEKKIAKENLIDLMNITQKGSQERDKHISKQSQALRNQCIELELDLNIESPDEDRAKRMELQVMRLNKKFNQKVEERTSFEKLLHAYRVGGLYSYQDKTLTGRLETLAGNINKI